MQQVSAMGYDSLESVVTAGQFVCVVPNSPPAIVAKNRFPSMKTYGVVPVLNLLPIPIMLSQAEVTKMIALPSDLLIGTWI